MEYSKFRIYPNPEQENLIQRTFGIARLHEHIASQGQYTLHKLATRLIRDNDIICVENLSSQNMMKNYRLARTMADAAWSEFRRQLEHSGAWYGRQINAIDKFYPSSQLLCSEGDDQNPLVKDLAVRRWTCHLCGTEHDRDVNAARNILREDMRIAA